MRPGRKVPRIDSRLASTLLSVLLILVISPSLPASPPGRFLVVCSPGSPGDTLQAQPTMNSLARAAALSAGWPEESLAAIYFETAEGGLARLLQPDAALALVPPAFLSRYGEELDLRPRMEAVLESGKSEIWSLAAGKGRISSPSSLKGWEITGAPGFAPEFVRAELLGTWGALPEDARITFTARILTALRRASTGEDVGVLMDSTQTAALSTLPFARDLEIVWRSRPVPGAILCTVGNRLPAADADALVRGLAALTRLEGGPEVLKSMRLSRFTPLDADAKDRFLRPRRSATPGTKP